MPGLRPGAVPAAKMGTREWSRFCDQTLLYTMVTVTTTTFTAAAEELILADDDTAAGVITITLPTVAPNKGRPYTIKKMGSTANVVIDGEGAETIDGATTLTLTTQYEKTTIVSSGSEWVTV